MKRLCIKSVGFASAFILLLAPGCSDNSSAPVPLTTEQLPAVFQKTFNKATPPIKDLVNEVISAVQTNGYGRAHAGLQALSTAPGLTKEQSSTVGRAMVTVNGMLQAAAAKGDERAAQVIQTYRSQK